MGRRQCRYCDGYYPDDKINRHEHNCPNRKECPWCSKPFRKSLLASHKLRCPRRPGVQPQPPKQLRYWKIEKIAKSLWETCERFNRLVNAEPSAASNFWKIVSFGIADAEGEMPHLHVHPWTDMARLDWNRKEYQYEDTNAQHFLHQISQKQE